jgi:hypothetical protein
MKKQLLTICGLLIFSVGAIKAQLSGPYSVPGSYTSVAAAITDLNTQGVSGPVTINIAAGYTETAPLGGFTLTATGTLANPITFQKSGTGANPLITAATGGTSVPNSVTQDGIWSLIGSDYITIDAIDLLDPNTTNPSTMEYGYGLFKASATNGCQNNTIKNCVITLNKVNNAAGSGPAVDGSRGVNVVNSLITSQTTNVTITSASGANSNNKFYTNTIQNCNIGISMIGFASVSPFTTSDTGNDIGGSSSATGNTIVNFGGGAAVSPAAGVRTLAQYNLNVSNNIITNNNGTGADHAAIIRGIYVNTATSANATINSNTLTITSAVTSAQVSIIENVSGATAANNTVSIANNLIANCTNTAATTSVWYGIWNQASCAYLVISGNTYSNNATKATSGTTYLIYNSGAVASTNNITNNSLSFNHNGATGYTGTLYNIYNGSSLTTSTINIVGNNYSNYNHSVTGTGVIYFMYNPAGNSVLNISNNSISNLSLNHSGTEYCFYNGSSTQSLLTIAGNSITNNTRNAAAGSTYCFYDIGSSSGVCSQTVANNLITNITATVAGSGTFYSFYLQNGGTLPYPKKSINSNTVSAINYNSTGSFYGMYSYYFGDGSTTSGSIIYNNLFDNITWNGTMYVMYLGAVGSPNYPPSVYTNTMSNITSNGAFSTIYANYLFGGAVGFNYYKNRTYGITENGTSGIAYGMYVSGSPANIYNNLIGSIATPSASGANRVNGIYIGGGSAANVYFNTVNLSGTSTGATFGSNALYASTAVNLDLRDNILVNNCIPTGSEFAVAYRRSSTSLTTYLNSSNNNLFYAGTPSANNLIFYDGVNPQQTLAAYQTFVAPRDVLSVTENPNYVSTVGSNPNFLNINTSIATLIESGGTTVPGITTDYIGTTRNPSTPDIGAWEGNYTPVSVCAGTPSAGVSSISSSTGCPNYVFTLSNTGQTSGAGMSYQWYSAPTSSGPWTIIVGANGSSYTTTASAAVTFYQFVVTCTASAMSATAAPVSFTVVNPGPCVCNNYGPSNATSTADEEILNVTVGSLNNSSTCTTLGPGPGSMMNMYSNYAGFLPAPTFLHNQVVPFSFQIGTCGGNFGNSVKAYIDYNQNGLFTDPGEQVYASAASTTGPHFETGNITIPATASVGITRMRVISVETTPANIFPTGSYTWGETEDYCIDIQAPVTCSGTPNSGTTAINTPSGCPNVTLNLVANGVTNALGITYQWYTSPSPTGPWTAITNATLTTYSTVATSTTTYWQMVTTCSVSAQTATTSIASYSVVNPGPCVCAGYGPSGASSTADEEILNVTFGTLNNNSTCTTLGPGPGSLLNRYSNYSNFVAAPVVLQGQSVPFSLQIGTCGGNFNNSIAVYIDYNQNGLFTDAGEQAYLSAATTNGPHVESGNITIPLTASVGVTRMRVVNVETTPANIFPNNTYTWGETEDYCIDIQTPTPCSGTPNSGTAAINTPSGCPNVTLNLVATGLTNALGISYQWYSSPSPTGPWTAISNATATTYSTNVVTSTTYFQLVTTCSVSAQSATTSIVSYSLVNPGPCVCSNYGTSGATQAFDEEIFNVTFGTLNSTSTCTTLAPGPGSIVQRYSNYAGFNAIPTVLQGQSVPFSINVGTCGGNYDSGVSIFIDYNQNGLFTDAGEQAFLSTASTNGPYIATGNVSIPLTASVGVTRMRIVNMETTNMALILPTGTYGYGETEDYCIDIQVPQPCTGAPNSGTAAISTATGCITDPFSVTATGLTNALGISYQWYSSPSPTGPWSSISSATNVTYSTTASSVIYFQMVTTCSNSAMSATTSVVSYTPFQCYTMSNATITSCTGTLYDSGGPNNNYQNNENYTLTIVPSAANSSVIITFANFNLESGWDYLYIYNGNSTAAPLIGQYSGNTLPPSAMATNTAGILTLRMTSDPSVVLSGFQAALTCSNSCAGPPASPVTNGSVICSGNSATLTTAATGTAQWYATSTPSNAIATGSVYVTPTLTANITYYVSDSTSCGQSTLTPVTVTVNPLPNVISVTGATVCSGNSTSISAMVTGTAQWYATSTPTAPLATGTLYTTPILNNTTTYYVRDTSMCGTSSLTPVTVTVIPTPTVSINASPSSVICAGNMITLTASGADTYTWNTSATSTVISATPLTNTTYTLDASSMTCPGSYTASIFITVNPNPTVNIVSTPGSMSICAGNSATLNASGATLYSWNTSATTQSIMITPTVSTTYVVVGTAANNCTTSAQITITVNPRPNVSLSAASNTACLNSGPVALIGSPSGGVYSGANVSGSNLNPTATGTFMPTYSYTNAAGCTNTAVTSVVVYICTDIVSQSARSTYLKVYPNPNFGTFTVETGNDLKKTIELTDVTGRIVRSEITSNDIIHMNITELANGLYQMSIRSENGIDIIKVVKQ